MTFRKFIIGTPSQNIAQNTCNAPSELQSHALHTWSNSRGVSVCVLENAEGQSKAGIWGGEGGRMSLRIIEVTWTLQTLLLPGVY